MVVYAVGRHLGQTVATPGRSMYAPLTAGGVSQRNCLESALTRQPFAHPPPSHCAAYPAAVRGSE